MSTTILHWTHASIMMLKVIVPFPKEKDVVDTYHMHGLAGENPKEDQSI